MKWISVKERLPEENKEVLLRLLSNPDINKYVMGTTFLNPVKKVTLNDIYEVYYALGNTHGFSREYTHWMEIEPPKDEE